MQMMVGPDGAIGSGLARSPPTYVNFDLSRKPAHSCGVGLKSANEWKEYCKKGKKPGDIPAAPYLNYANNGWAGFGDWLGTGTVSNRHRQFKSFKKARAFVRGHELKSVTEWQEYCKSGKKPDHIPANPYQAYAKDGWSGMPDWLGYARKP
jgi:hypothetical protein